MPYLINALICCFAIANSECFDAGKLPDKIGLWIKEEKILEFSPDNLYDYIDGEADRYLPYNFQKLIVLFYRKETHADSHFEIQIYRMATHLDAFGIYSVQRDRNKSIFHYGEDGFIGDNQSMFYQGQYFIKLMTRGTDNPQTELETFGKVLSQLLPKSDETIPELSCLDQKEKITRSECYLAKDVLAQSFLPRGTTALYEIGEKTATGFIVMFPNEEETKKGWSKYKDYLEEIYAEFESEVENTITITSPSSETAVISLLKKHLVGVWLPDGDINEIKSLQEKIKLCLIQKLNSSDSDKAEKQTAKE